MTHDPRQPQQPEGEKPAPDDAGAGDGRRKAHDALTRTATAAARLTEVLSRLKPDDPWPADEARAFLGEIVSGVEPAVLWHRYERGHLPYGADQFPFFAAVQAGLQEALVGAGRLVTALGALERLQASGRFELREEDRTHLLAAVVYAGGRLLAESDLATELLAAATEKAAAPKGAPPGVN
jgi:hypothetical protein